ncbi:MAG: YceI family protein [Saprospirales bacterium]|nr:YceI family protein [Saprospirales bacterium]
MNNSFFRTLIFALLMVPAVSMTAGTGPIETYKVNLASSKFAWRGYKVTGQHHGVISLTSGSLQFQDGKLTGGQFVADMNTIDVLDMTGEYGDKLEGHLKSDDFFGAATYPNATLTFTKVTFLGDNEYDISADLKIKGNTGKLQFKATVIQAGNQILADAAVKIDRSKYDVRYGSSTFFGDMGDKAIYDEFDLTISLVAGK